MPHLFVDISAHGLGHLAQVAPVLNALNLPALRITIRSGLSLERLQARINIPFAHIHAATDFGYVMHNALEVDLLSSAKRYQEAHTNWEQRVKDEATFLGSIAPDLVLTDVSYLPLAGAAAEGISALAMSSLNWADLFAHYFGHEAWAAPIHQQILSAYQSAAAFLCLTPGMPMENLPKRVKIGTIATGTQVSRIEAAQRLNLPLDKRWVLVALGGIEHRLPVENWPSIPGVHWLLPTAWQVQREDASNFDEQALPFADLLPNVDVIVTKPGYGTFAEASCNGVPVLYLRRPDWPEEPYLIEWLLANNRAHELSPTKAANGQFAYECNQTWEIAPTKTPQPHGIQQACEIINSLLPSR